MPNTLEKAASKTLGAAKVVKATFKGLDGVFKKLMEEHGEVSALIMRVSVSSDSSVRADLYPTIRAELLAHERGELSTVYPELGQYPKTSGMAARHAAEAGELESAITSLDALAYSDTRWAAHFEQLASLVKKHVEEEESVIFPMAQETLGDERSKALKISYEATKGSPAHI